MASPKFVLAFALLATLAVSAAYAEFANDIADGATRDLKTIKLGGLKSKFFSKGYISKGYNYDHDNHNDDHNDHDNHNDYNGHKKVFRIKHDYDHDDHKKVFKVPYKKKCEDECYCYYDDGHYFKHYQHGCKEVECDCHKYSHAVFKKVQKCHQAPEAWRDATHQGAHPVNQ